MTGNYRCPTADPVRHGTGPSQARPDEDWVGTARQAVLSRALCLTYGLGTACWAIFWAGPGQAEKHDQSSVSGQPEAHKEAQVRRGGTGEKENGEGEHEQPEQLSLPV